MASLPAKVAPINTRAKLAKLANVSERTYDKIKTVLESDFAADFSSRIIRYFGK